MVHDCVWPCTPARIGTARTVNMRGGIVGDVYSHMAFRFNAASSGPIAAFAEYHRVVAPAGSCKRNALWLAWVCRSADR